MSQVLLQQVKVIDPGGPHHDAHTDILVIDGRIARIGGRITKGEARVINGEHLHVSPGWVDLRAHFREPGEEWKQGIQNGLDAAARGGFTAVAVLPSTKPAIDGRSGITHLLHRAEGHAVRLLPLGALTQDTKGEQLAELHDQREAGAVGFTDDKHSLRNSRLMLLALHYTEGLPGGAPPLMVHPADPYLSHGGQMHEGAMSTRLGLKGLPAMAEALALQRDITLLEYAGGHLHAATISTAESVELVRAAKAKGLRITASVAAYNLLLDDGCLRGFETCYKVFPPLRSARHIDALREAVKDGTIDAIVSDHRPEDREHKLVEYGQAAFGIIGLETQFAVANTALKGRMSLRRLIERLSHGPRSVIGLPVPHIAEGAEAELSLFDPEVNWTCEEADLVSRSHNTPFLGQRFAGRAIGIISNGKVVLHP
ncbi:MAG: dihydroorotase [Flavobacteriales bacterium]